MEPKFYKKFNQNPRGQKDIFYFISKDFSFEFSLQSMTQRELKKGEELTNLIKISKDEYFKLRGEFNFNKSK
jgi:hypothetical protein